MDHSGFQALQDGVIPFPVVNTCLFLHKTKQSPPQMPSRSFLSSASKESVISLLPVSVSEQQLSQSLVGLPVSGSVGCVRVCPACFVPAGFPRLLAANFGFWFLVHLSPPPHFWLKRPWKDISCVYSY